MYICKYCGKEFETSQKLGGHVSKCKYNPNYNDNINKIIFNRTININKENPIEEYKCKCIICGNEYIVKTRKNNYNNGNYKKTCSTYCAHKLTYLNCNKKIKNKKISESLHEYLKLNKHINKQKTYICEYCGKEFNKSVDIKSYRFCSKECSNLSKRKKCSENAKKINFGGYKPNSIKKHHHGIYKGILFDSSWELACIIYCLEHNIKIERCKDYRTYINSNNEEKRYIPDFIINNKIVEIKGYYSIDAQLKSKYNPDIKVMLYDDIKVYLDYCIEKYGKRFWDIINI